MSWAAVGFASGVIGAYGALEQGKAEESAQKFNAAMARKNKALAREAARREAESIRVMGEKALGSIEAGYSASGVTMEGSAYDIMAESMFNIEMDKANVIYQGEVQAKQYEAEARMAKYRGQMAKRGSYFSAASSLLGGAAQGASMSNLSGGGAKAGAAPRSSGGSSGVGSSGSGSGYQSSFGFGSYKF